MNLKTMVQSAKSFRQNMDLFLNPYKEVNIYVPELNVIYIGISKTGISSMKSLFLNKLGEQYDRDDYQTIHSKGSKVFKYVSKKEITKKHCYKFGFVRNPFDRLVSCYKNKILDEAYPPIQYGYGNLFYKEMPFDEFVKNVSKIPDILSDRHFRSQYSYLFYKGKLIVDFLGKFENIEKDFEVIKEKYNLYDLPHINKTQKIQSYRDYYSSELVELVYKRYQKDIEKFDYQNELEDLKTYVKKKR